MSKLQTTHQHDIAVIGGGIGGASAAVALQSAGFDVHVYEQASTLREIGGAIIVREPSMAFLESQDVLNSILPKMSKVSEIELREKNGTIVGSTSIEFQKGEGEFAYSVHRADLHNALISRLKPGTLHLSHRLKALRNLERHAEVLFENGESLTARLLIGADGLRSTVRSYIDSDELNFVGIVTHRTISPSSILPSDMPNDRLRMWSSEHLHFITLPIRNGTEVALDAVIPSATPPEKLWSSTSAEELLALYSDFDPVVGRLIQGRIVDVTTHPVYDKSPIAKWGEGHIVLLGDAAHPMAPMQGQGANQAIQDADVLLNALIGPNRNDLNAALQEYQSVRAPIAGRLQTLSRTPPISNQPIV